MSAEPRYQLTITRAQAEVLRDACELLARCRLGQIADACQQVLDAHGQAVVPYDLAQDCEAAIKAEVGLAPNQSWGSASIPPPICRGTFIRSCAIAWPGTAPWPKVTSSPARPAAGRK